MTQQTELEKRLRADSHSLERDFPKADILERQVLVGIANISREEQRWKGMRWPMQLLAATAVVVFAIAIAIAVHVARSNAPVGPHPSPRSSLPLRAEPCRAQCNVASQEPLQPKAGAVGQCSDGCEIQSPAFASANVGYFADSIPGPVGPAFLYRTDDGGQHWRPLLSWDGRGAEQIRINGDGSEVLVITAWGSRGRTLFHSSDSGAHWFASALPAGADQNSPIYFLNSREGWIITASLDLIHTADSGQHWARVARLNDAALHASGLPNQVIFFSPSAGFYFGSDGSGPVLYVTHDGGATWKADKLVRPIGQKRPNWTVQTIKRFDGHDGVLDVAYWPTGLISCGSDNPCSFDYVYTTSDAGLHWSGPTALPGERTIFIDTNHWLGMTGAFTDILSVVVSYDGGRHWQQLSTPGQGVRPSPTAMQWDPRMYMDFTDAQHGWAVSPLYGTALSPWVLNGTDTEYLWLTSDGGLTWARRTLPS